MVDNLDFIERVVEAGVSGFAINLELQGSEAALLQLGMKYRTTRRHFEAFIDRAVQLTGGRGTGNVRSLIIPGLEPLDATLEGVEWIASLGADPVLSPFRPAVDTALAGLPPAPEDMLSEALVQSRAIANKHGVRLGPRCLPCQHNTLSFPWDVG
jgi:hypothetical protein